MALFLLPFRHDEFWRFCADHSAKASILLLGLLLAFQEIHVMLRRCHSQLR